MIDLQERFSERKNFFNRLVLAYVLFGILFGTLFSYYIEDIRKFISNTFDITLFPEEIYFLSTLPSEINVNSIILIALCSIITTSIVSIFPASRAAKLDTIQTLKYE